MIKGSGFEGRGGTGLEICEDEDDPSDDKGCYESCIKIKGRPILPPVMTEDVRQECRMWKAKAIQKEQQIRSNNQNKAALKINEYLNDFKSQLVSKSCPDISDLSLDLGPSDSEESSSDHLTDSDLEPKSFAEIHSLLKQQQRQQKSSSDSARSSVVSSTSTQSVPSTPSTYEPNLYSDSEYQHHAQDLVLEPFENLERLEARADIYDSLQSLNTVIENPSPRSLKQSASPSDSIMLSEGDSDKENSNASVGFRPRKGSYTLDKPSPLLAAHLQKFGSEEDRSNHDMSSYQKTPSPSKIDTIARLKNIDKETDPLNRSNMLKRYLDGLGEIPVPVVSPLKNNQAFNQASNCTRDSSTSGPKPPITALNIETSSCEVFNRKDPPKPHPTPLRLQSNLSVVSSPSLSLTPLPFPAPSPSVTPLPSQSFCDASSTAPTPDPSSLSWSYSQTNDPSSTNLSDPSQLEQAVSSLANQHQQNLTQLMAKQEQERLRLREQFEAKQRELVEQIVKQFPNLSAGMIPDLGAKQQTIVGSNSEQAANGNSTATPLESKQFHQNIFLDSDNTRDQKDIVAPKPIKLVIPDDVYSVVHEAGWLRLTALARGFLVRRLVSTEKVQFLKQTIRETISCAVRLHLEADGPPSQQDQDLHGRLLVQLESACHSVHRIFFDLGVPERMSIIALDRAAKSKVTRRDSPNEKKISAATLSRLESKARSSGSKLTAESRAQRTAGPRTVYTSTSTRTPSSSSRKSNSTTQKRRKSRNMSRDRRSSLGGTQRRSIASLSAQARRSSPNLASHKQSSTKPAWK